MDTKEHKKREFWQVTSSTINLFWNRKIPRHDAAAILAGVRKDLVKEHSGIFYLKKTFPSDDWGLLKFRNVDYGSAESVFHDFCEMLPDDGELRTLAEWSRFIPDDLIDDEVVKQNIARLRELDAQPHQQTHLDNKSIDDLTNKPIDALTTRERNTAAVIIAALCHLAGKNHNQRGLAMEIVKAADELGAKISDDTVREWLKGIDDALDARGY